MQVNITMFYLNYFCSFEETIMQRRTLLILLWFFVGLMIRTTHARHNITAALVALAPVSDTDVETALNVNEKDGNAGSAIHFNWILLSAAVILQCLLLLR